MRQVLAILSVSALLLAACYRSGESTCNQENEPLAPLRGITVNGRTNEPLANVHVFVELCGRYTENPNPGKGHPNYRYGGVTDKDGRFEIMVPRGPVGLHTFKPYFQYGTEPLEDSTTEVRVGMSPNGDRPDPVVTPGTTPACAKLAEKCGACIVGSKEQATCNAAVARGDAAACDAAGSDPTLTACTGRTPTVRPVLTGLSVSSTKVRPGEPLRFSLNAKSDAKDPLSEEVLLLQPETNVARAFDPPVRGAQAIGFANGLWKVTLPAPTKAGVYRYYASVSSEGCVTGVGEPMLDGNKAPLLDRDRTPMREQPYVSVTVE